MSKEYLFRINEDNKLNLKIIELAYKKLSINYTKCFQKFISMFLLLTNLYQAFIVNVK